MLTSVFIVFLGLVQIAYLIKYVNRTNRELAEFLTHLQQGDTSLLFSKENIEKTFKGLRNSFEKINTDVKQIKAEKEQKEHYLKYVIDNIKTGLLAFNEFGNIEFVNDQAKMFLNKENLRLLNVNELEDEFVKVLHKTKSSESTIIKKTINDNLYYLAFSSSEFKIDNKKVRLFTIHDVKQEIETNEIESWQKLTSVLTHEMMNSITPITSLAHAIKRYLKNNDKLLDQEEISNELISDIVKNADIIENRGKGLLEFIDNYRTITKLPKPKFETFKTGKFLHKIIQLFDNEIKKKNIIIVINVKPEDLSLLADRSMIEQVIINLIKNSIEALINIPNPRIKLNSFIDQNQKIKIQVIDNGKGISKDIIDDVFIPFYTTKQNSSGVGLSLSRQIMSLHKGTISVTSNPNTETVFTLKF
ncbi:MAG: ATP-binding protein [Bacteroidales bacterium]|nr:ATP-binding protein [Bacteroidales bacterium]